MLVMPHRRYKGAILIPNHHNAHIICLFITKLKFFVYVMIDKAKMFLLDVTEADLFDKTSVNLMF